MRRMLGLAFVTVLFLALSFSIVSAACTDSDNGKDYYTEGTTNSQKDFCLVQGGTLVTITEYYCENNEVKEISYQCPYGCALDASGTVLGKCAGDGSVVPCSDSDDELDYYTKGKVTARNFSREDFCLTGDEKKLFEWTCENSKFQFKTYDCPAGCKDGACISADKPDLIITDITMDPENPKPGEMFQPIIHYKNIGTATAVGFYIYGNMCGTEGGGLGPDPRVTLAPGEEKEYLWGAATCEAGEHQADFEIDPANYNYVDESDETNNKFTKTFYIGDKPSQPPVNPAPMTPENPTYKADVENTGVACGMVYDCTGGGFLNWDCSVEYTGDYRCRAGDACIDKGSWDNEHAPIPPYCTKTVWLFNAGVTCGVGSSNRGICKDATAPTIRNIVKDVSSTSATIKWTTDEAADSYIVELKDQKTKAVQKFELPGKYYLLHSASFSGLKADNAYWFTIKAVDAAGNAREATDGFTTLKEEPLKIMNVKVTPTKTSVSVDWETNKPLIGKEVKIDSEGYVTTASGTSHKMTIVPLNPGEFYYCTIIATGTNGETATASCDFTTIAEQTTQPEEKCTDTDPDVDYYKQGYIQYGLTVVWDMCGLRNSDGTFTEKWSCKDESNCVLFETLCLPENQTGGFGSRDYVCRNGCKEGACVQGEDLPNLIITDLIFSNDAPKPNEFVYASAVVKNIGVVDAVFGKSFVQLFVGSNRLCAAGDDGTVIKAGESKTMKFDCPIRDKPKGTYVVTAKANYNNAMEESNYQDNTYKESITFADECLPDLAISSYNLITKSYVLENQTFDIKVKASNNGCSPTTYQEKYDHYDADMFLGEKVRLPVDNKFRTITFVSTDQSGITIDVDGVQGKIQTVGGNPTTINGVKMTQWGYAPGAAMLEINLPCWHIANINGEIITGAYWLADIPIASYPEKNVFGDAITKDEPIPINGGSYITKIWKFKPNVGWKNLTFFLDPDNIIKESDETNNQLYQQVYLLTKEVNCSKDFTLTHGEKAIILGRGSNAISVGSIQSDNSVSITIQKDFKDDFNNLDSMVLYPNTVGNLMSNTYTVFYKSTDGTSATLQLTNCPMGMYASTPSVGLRSGLTGGFALLLPELSWLRFLKRTN